MKQIRKRVLTGFSSVIIAIMIATLLFPAAAYADMPYTDEKGNYVEWYADRNSQENNAVTNSFTPVSDSVAWEKWSVRLGTDYNASPTPPVIVNHRVYTAAGTKLYELDKDTGEVLRESEDMPGRSSYAMFSPTYADGRIFVSIGNSRICAFDIDDHLNKLALAWTSDNSEILKGQMNCPISYKKIDGTGYLFTGSRMDSRGELLCVTTDNEGVAQKDGQKIKKLKWHFNAKVTDAKNLAGNNCEAAGYYWTGAYVSDKYLAVGSDNGLIGGDNNADTAFYTLDPKPEKLSIQSMESKELCEVQSFIKTDICIFQQKKPVYIRWKWTETVT